MSGGTIRIRSIDYRILLFSLPIIALFLFSLGAASYQGGILSFTMFGVIAVTYATTAAIWRPSIFLSITALFLSLGFIIKLFALNFFDVELIEPVGQFNGATQWDTALNFASAGLFGGTCANYVSSFAPSTRWTARPSSPMPATARPFLFLLLVVLMVFAVAVYGINLRWNILRIGYTLGVDLPFPLYPILAFIIAWGALIGALTLVWWLQDLDKPVSFAALYISGIVGLMASLTMGSRVQFLLYILAAVLVIASKDGVKALFRTRVLTASLICGLLFVLSIAAVSLQRSFDFTYPVIAVETRDTGIRNEPAAGLTERVPTEEATGPTMSVRIQSITHELKSLLIMRWVGLEGVMTTAGSPEQLGIALFSAALHEYPAMGANGIYQHMSGDRYANVKDYVFLTLPGPIGVASYTGNLVLIVAFVFVCMLLGHALELYCASVTRNLGCTSAVGVSLAYLFVQMGFPWTLFIYCVELFLTISVIALLRLALLKFAVNDRKVLPAQA
ncbi:hypothetical protein OSJ77_00535 [Phyllobacterium sp. 0TCS1.6C]|uniref:hypothetical protein n=1 Tax=unclassified Phyllobacterium TaxID=2638441 RepID=UPI002264C1D5|nr:MULTISPECIES: hypothetical protein [unclassified Phyllobacterium]MCX8278674.1 hypothetical protein [Phyllobacterium sp. 0TCS1.6C]MCX8293496.1 hypothetical protein [Phyllobacterium sp. 0TCS1.6A]